MNKRVLVKLVGLNLAIGLLNIIIYVDSIPGFSVATENVFLKALSYTFSVLSVLIFVLGNKHLIPLLTPITDIINVEEEESKVALGDRGEEFANNLRTYKQTNIQTPDLTKRIDSALDQIQRVYRSMDKYMIILNRNRNTAKDLVDDGDRFKNSVLDNIRIILNNVTFLDQVDPSNPHEKDLYQEHLDRIETILKTNEDILENFKEMIRLIIDMDGNINKMDARLISVVATLNQLYRINYKEDK